MLLGLTASAGNSKLDCLRELGEARFQLRRSRSGFSAQHSGGYLVAFLAGADLVRVPHLQLA